MNPEDYIDYTSETWRALEALLLKQKEAKVSLLISADDHDKSNQIRGALQFITYLLALRKAPNTGR